MNVKPLPGAENFDAADPYNRQTQTFPTLTAQQIERMTAFGKIEHLAKGTVLFEQGDRGVDFFVVLSGEIEIYERESDNGLRVITVHRENQFTGELDLFNDRKILVGGRMGVDGKVLRIRRLGFRRLLTAEPDIAEIITRAFILRRVGLISHEQGGVTMLCVRQSSESLRIEQFLVRNGYPLSILDDPNDTERQELMRKLELSEADLPAVLVHRGEKVLRNPGMLELADGLGMTERLDPDAVYEVAVIGAGPAGLSAAVYAASEGLSTLVIETEAPGGQAGTSSKIENYLGFPTGISGQALAGRAQIQAQKFGAKIALPRSVTGIDCATHPFTIQLSDNAPVKAKTVVIASGARYRTLDIGNGRKFDNAGIYYSASAAESELCVDEDVIVVGGGNSAGQAAVFLSRKSKHVNIFIRGHSLSESMSQYLLERIEASDRITVHAHTEIMEVKGNRFLEEVTWENSKTGERTTRPIQHVFLMLGAVPNTEWLQNCVQLDNKGFVLTGIQLQGHSAWKLKRNPMMLETSVPGIFAAGDVRSASTKRVAFAVGDGGMTVTNLHLFLSENE